MSPGSEVETARKWLHLAPGSLAFALPWLGFGGGLALCALLLAFNLWVLPRFGGTRLWRPAEQADGEAWAILFYPLALLVLALAAGRRLEVLAGAWAMLAFGDAAATLVGRRWGRAALPWHPGKSWIGSAAFVVASWLGVAILVIWTSPGGYEARAVVWAAGLAALVGAVAESLPWTLDDNLSVTLLGGGALFVGLEFARAGVTPSADGSWIVMLAVVALALLARAADALDGAGAATGAVVGLAVAWRGGWPALSLLALFVVAGSVAGRGRAQRRDARSRGVANVLANGAVAAVCGLAMAIEGSAWALPAFGGALATAMADTVGGEVGQAVGGATRRLSDLREVPPGTDGGVSWAGTAATLVAAASLGAAGWLVGLFEPVVAGLVAAAGGLGAFVDSLLGATFERRGLLDNEATNCLSTLAGAWVAAAAAGFWL